MRRPVRNAVLLLAVVGFAFACGDDGYGGDGGGGPQPAPSPTYPQLTGAYTATWTLAVTFENGQQVQGVCSGTMDITTQNAGTFSGSFIIDETEDCSSGSGTVNGTVGTDGTVSVTFAAAGQVTDFLEAATGCVAERKNQPLTGTYAGNTLTASVQEKMSCTDDNERPFNIVVKLDLSAIRK